MTTSKYTPEVLRVAVSKSTSLAGVLRALGFQAYSGGMSAHIRNKLEQFGICTKHFTGLAVKSGKRAVNRKSPAMILTAGHSKRVYSAQLRRALLEMGAEYKCATCGQLPEWCGKPLTLQVDHIDGDWSNNQQGNLRFLCLHCHSQTPTFGVRNFKQDPKRAQRLQKHRVCRRCGGLFIRKSKGPYCGLECARVALAHLPKIQWPNAEELTTLVGIDPVETVAKKLGVSGNAVRKRCKKLGIKVPARGYWQKQRHRYTKDCSGRFSECQKVAT